VDKIDPLLQAELQSAQPGQMVTAIVTLKEQLDLRSIGGIDRAGRQEAVIRALLAKANASQVSLTGLLQTRRSLGSVSQITPFWVFNGLSVTATADVFQELASRPDVLKITPDDIQLVPLSPPAAPPEQNLSVINAPALWSLGWQGQGVVIGVMDSGVYGSHPDLTTRWRGGTNSWYDPYGQHSTPFDASGHGTWTTGVLVGGEAGGTAIGVAPQAQWIAAKIFNDAGTSTATAVHLAFQWMLDPDENPGTADAPHVANNSWGFSAPGCNLEYQLDLQALRAAGILPVFSAGNSGPNPSTSVSPANYPEALAVGATNNSDVVANDSSRGPSDCGGEGEAIYPEIVAPGVSVRTTDLLGFYTNASGTSVAAPHVAGALALLLSAFPNLTVDQQSTTLTTTAVDLGDLGADNTYGAGRLDVLAAYNRLVEPVGGIAELPDIARRPSGAANAPSGGYAALAAGLAAMLAALSTGAWYAKRRWGR
jgi:subtilisin family serine protease